MQRSFTFALLLVVCFVVLAAPVAAQEDSARVRMGFVALDPTEYDLYINGEIAPEWGSGFADGQWMGSIIPSPWDYINCCSVTPYFPMPAETYSIAFTPKGGDLNNAVLGPIEVTLEADHVYSLAVLGAIEDNSLALVPIDETAAFAEADPLNDLTIILINNVPGFPSVTMSGGLDTTIEYGSYAAIIRRGGAQVLYDSYAEEALTHPLVTVDFPSVPARVTEFHAMIGPQPGSSDTRNRFSFNHGYSGDVTIREAGPIALGETLEGALENLHDRNRYTLELEQPATLNIRAHGRGNTTRNAWGEGPVDTALYVYDSAGKLLFWNDEDSVADDWIETPSSDAGIDALPLEAGTYFIDVGLFTDLSAGPYDLTVEEARPTA